MGYNVETWRERSMASFRACSEIRYTSRSFGVGARQPDVPVRHPPTRSATEPCLIIRAIRRHSCIIAFSNYTRVA